MRKVKVVRSIDISGEAYFFVYADDKLIKSFAFDDSKPNKELWSEEVNKKQALDFAKKIETGEYGKKETIYETNEKDESLS